MTKKEMDLDLVLKAQSSLLWCFYSNEKNTIKKHIPRFIQEKFCGFPEMCPANESLVIMALYMLFVYPQETNNNNYFAKIKIPFEYQCDPPKKKNPPETRNQQFRRHMRNSLVHGRFKVLRECLCIEFTDIHENFYAKISVRDLQSLMDNCIKIVKSNWINRKK